jgi:hypothetical protein
MGSATFGGVEFREMSALQFGFARQGLWRALGSEDNGSPVVVRRHLLKGLVPNQVWLRLIILALCFDLGPASFCVLRTASASIRSNSAFVFGGSRLVDACHSAISCMWE